MAGPRLGNGALTRLGVHGGFNTDIAHIGHSKISLITDPRLRLRVKSHIAVINDRLTIDRTRGMLNGSVGHLGRPGLVPVFLNVTLKYVLNDVPFVFPKVPRPIGLKLTKNPLVISVLVDHFNPRCGLVACAAVDTGLVVERVNVSLFLTYINLKTNSKFIRAVVRRNNCI